MLAKALGAGVVLAFDAFTVWRIVHALLDLPQHPSAVFWTAIALLVAIAIAATYVLMRIIRRRLIRARSA